MVGVATILIVPERSWIRERVEREQSREES